VQPAENKQLPAVQSIKVTVAEGMFPAGDSIATRFAVPEGFSRLKLSFSSFGSFLRNLPLKAPGTPVHCYDGSLKRNQSVHAAVIDLDVGARDLQQCADAIIRLRAEYLWQQEAFDSIHFHFTNGFLADYAKWRRGNRIIVNGNSVSWTSSQVVSTDYKNFRSYLNMVFAYAGTLSLTKELKERPLADIAIGDVFIHGGSPGHAIIVVDLAYNPETNEKLVLLAQSYMPAQDIHVLNNPTNTDLSPWYAVKDMTAQFSTPEWTFKGSDLKHF
jgi:hypothetical protein